MFHMLSCFDLDSEITIDEFKQANDKFFLHMQELGLVHSVGSIGRRNKHPVLDTDDERSQEYFYIMSFVDEAQSNRAVDCIYAHQEPEEGIHNNVSLKTKNSIFICWEDI